MKKFFLLLALATIAGFSTMNSAKAQTDNFELGIRFGAFYGIGGAAVDAMIPVSDNRLHGNFDFNRYGFGLSLIYDWQAVFGNGVEGSGEFLWYAGVGGGIYIWDANIAGVNFGGTGLSVLGEVGIEYEFDVPIAVGIDLRPGIGIGDYVGFGVGGGLNVRYRF